jgi:anti-repressor protein
MTDLIAMTTHEQGFYGVASARQLYDFLGFDPAQWSRWSKKNIVNNPYAKQGEDWKELDTASSSIRKSSSQDYALALEFAKRLSLLVHTEKAEEVRRYFLACEKKVQLADQLSLEQVLIQQAHTLIEQGNLIAQLRADMDQLQAARKPTKAPHLADSSKNSVSEFRQLINRKVNEYCGFHGAEQSETYTYLYRRLHELYCINVYRLLRKEGETILDALERYNHLDKVYGLIVAELTYSED